MAVTKHTARQHVLNATVILGIAGIGTGNETTISIPPGAYIRSLIVDTLVAFNGTTNTLTITDPATLVSAVDVKTTGLETVATLAGKYFVNGTTLTIAMAQTGTATAGSVLVTVDYVDVDRQDEHYKV